MNFIERATIALAQLPPAAGLYGLSAAHLHGLHHDEPELLDVVVPWGSLRPVVDGVRVRQTRGTGRRPLLTDPLPHTDVVDTVLDLGDRTDGETCVFWLTEATRRGLLTMDDVVAALGERRRHRHRVLMEEVGQDIASGATSNLEVRYVRHVERPHRLPRAQRQFVVPETGHRADFAYPGVKVLIEVDGLAYHQGEAAVRDARLDAEHAALGYVTRRYTWGPVVGSGCTIARDVVGLLRARGMDAEAQPCAAELARA